MSIASDTVALFRSEWDSRFIDTISVDAPDSGGTLNTTTLKYDGATPGANRYSGGALVRIPTGGVREEETQESRTKVAVDVYVPYSVINVEPDDVVTVSASLYEPELVGASIVVRSVEADSYNTRRLLRCELDLGSGSGRG